MTRALVQRPAAHKGAGHRSLGDALVGYHDRSMMPLTVLVLLLPLIIVYEVGTALMAADPAGNPEMRVLAFSLFRHFMEMFGATGRYLPAMAVVAILLTWHIARRDPWQPHVGTAMLMAVESALLAFPLLAIGNLLGHYLPLADGIALRGGMVLAIGAGIYEELVFRLIGFTVLNIVLGDLLRVRKAAAVTLIIVITSVMFAAYHHLSPYSPPFRWSDAIFRTAAGVYFAALFLCRGFGITAAVHIAYDFYYFIIRGAV
jgi:membrane protease YdiL (CAAX protease family)